MLELDGRPETLRQITEVEKIPHILKAQIFLTCRCLFSRYELYTGIT